MSTELDEKFEKFRVIGVLGAGQMGGGIAQVAAGTGYDVRLADASLELATKGKEKVAAALAKQVEKGKMSGDMRDSLLARITPIAGASGFNGCDLVVEAATENFDLKVKLLKECDAVMPRHAILASNTSSISITKLAAATSRAEQVIGMHFMNPPPLMKLIEIVRGVQTNTETHELVSRIAQRMGKTVITSKDMPGFLVNRILIPLLNEACFALQEGLGTPEDIDTGAKLGLNHPMGPFELADLIGLDTILYIAETFHRDFGDDKYRPSTMLRNLVAAGWYGRKTRRGFYVYDEKGTRTGKGILMTTYETITLEQSEGVATLTLNRPDKLNALSELLLVELRGALLTLKQDSGVRALIVTGAGKAFAAGADIGAMGEMPPTTAKAFADAGHAVGDALESAPFPSIAAVNGFALGGGCELALACDFIYASDKAKFGQPEVNLGVIPGFGGTQRLARRVGLGRARELCYTGDVIGAEEALRIGLVNAVYPLEELLAAARETARKIASKGPLAIAQCKRVTGQGADLPLERANELEAQAFALLFGTSDQREGMKAFLEKRPAKFTGR